MEGKLVAIVFVTLFAKMWMTTASPVLNGTVGTHLDVHDFENKGEEVSRTGIVTETTRIPSDVTRQRRANDFNHSCSTVAPIDATVVSTVDVNSTHNHAVKRAVVETNQTTITTISHISITTTPTLTVASTTTPTVTDAPTTTPTVTVEFTTTANTPNFTTVNVTSHTSSKNETLKLDYFDEDEDDESFLEALKDTVRKVVTYSIGLLLTPFVIGAPHVQTSEHIESNQIDTTHI